MAAYQLHVEIYEGPTLVVTHIFHGETSQQALHYYESHKRADAFLRECVDEGLYDGRVACSSKMHWKVTG